MPVPTVTIKIRVGPHLMERLQQVSRDLDVSPAGFIEHAIESELSRQEIDRQVEHDTLDALQESVLAGGQDAGLRLDEESSDDAVCQLCLRAVPRGPAFDGPMLCESCYSLARRDR